MYRLITLNFKKPVDAKINTKGGQYGATRAYGSHKGLDYLAYKKKVVAIEDGKVVYSGMRDGTEKKNNYGHTVIIDHIPNAGDDQRHIYSLYAHLDKRNVSVGKSVVKGQSIGVSGNSGLKAWYLSKKKPYKGSKQFHLHFEIIDTDKGFGDSKGWPSGLKSEYRKNPADYIDEEKIVEFPMNNEEISTLLDYMDFAPVFDIESGVLAVDVSLGSRRLGRIDKNNNEINVSMTPGELDIILSSPHLPRKVITKSVSESMI